MNDIYSTIIVVVIMFQAIINLLAINDIIDINPIQINIICLSFICEMVCCHWIFLFGGGL